LSAEPRVQRRAKRRGPSFFRQRDIDVGSGTLDTEELKPALAQLGLVCSYDKDTGFHM
jgi:hypothetical protein